MKITLDRRALDELIARLKPGVELRVGPDNPETALYGAIHETGGHPNRDGWLSQAVAQQRPHIEQELGRAAALLLQGDEDGARGVMEGLGLYLESAVVASIDERALIDTAALRRSISSEVGHDPDG